MTARTFLILLVPLALTACGIPDILAYGVKGVEKATEEPKRPPPPNPQVQPGQTITVTSPQAAQPEPPPPQAIAPRESVAKQPLN